MTFTTPHPRTPNGRPYPTIRGVTCQRCFLRMEGHPDHVCCFNRGYTSCRYCIGVRHACIAIPEEIQPDADSTMQLKGAEKKEGIRQIRQDIKMRTRKLNEEAKIQSAADQQLHQDLQDQLAFEQTPVPVADKSVMTDQVVVTDNEVVADNKAHMHVKSTDFNWMRMGWCSIL